MTTRRPAHRALVVACLVLFQGVAAGQPEIPAAPDRDDPPRVFVSGVEGDFAETRAAIAAAKQASGRDYRVVVVDTVPGAEDAGSLLEKVVDRWRAGSAEGEGGFNPAGDVTIAVDVGDRRIAMDVPWALEAAGLDSDTLEGDLIARTFVPRAADGLFDAGLADLVNATERWVRDRADEKRRAEEATREFRTRTLPIGLASLGVAGLLGGLAVQWSRHARRLREAQEKLATFKAEVVALSDLLDGEQERHRMLPHADADFRTPMEGMTRATYDNVQGSIRRYRERWLGLMDVWEKAQATVDGEWFLGTSAAEQAISLLDSADARPPLAEVAAECKAPLDALESAHEKAREAAAALEVQLSEATSRLDGVGRRGRSAASFQAAIADIDRGRRRAGEKVESDPVAARGGLEEARSMLDATVGRIDALEAGEDRRQRAVAATEEIRQRVRARRAEGWLLDEPGANPDGQLDAAARHADLAAQLLDAGETEAAVGNVERAEQANAEATALLESVVAAKAKAEELLPATAARGEALAAARRPAAAALERLAATYAPASWSDVADKLARADDALVRVATLIDQARAALAPDRQHYLRAVAILEEAERQEAWVEGCLSAITDRLAELDGLRSALPGRRDRAVERVRNLEHRLQRQRTDRIRANERCREAQRLVETGDRLAAASRPDPRQVEQALRAADSTAARGEEFADDDERLARQAAADLAEAEGLFRRAASWYAEGIKADVQGVERSLHDARSLLTQQRYEDSIRVSGEAAEHTRLAYAQATAEAERRRARRLAEQQRRQLEESFARMSRGAGPWMITLPSRGFTGPNPWRSSGSSPGGFGGGGRSAGGSWSRDVAEVRW